METVATTTGDMATMRWAMAATEVVETAGITLKEEAITTTAVTTATATTKEVATILVSATTEISATVTIMVIMLAIVAVEVATTTEEAPLQLTSLASSSTKTLTANKWESCPSEDA